MKKSAVVIAAALALWGCGEPLEAASAESAAPAEPRVQKAAVSATDPYVARHGLTAAQYQAEYNHWVGQGFRLTWVTGYEEGGTDRFAAIWELTSGPAWVSYAGMTSSQYQSTVTSLYSQGYRMVLVNAYSVGGDPRFAAIFHLDWSTAWLARHDMTSAQYQAEYNYWAGQGYRLAHVSGYTSYGAERYAAIWVYTGGWPQNAFHSLTLAQYQERANQLAASGYRLAQLSSYNVGGIDRYAGFFLQDPWAPPMVARYALTSEQYTQTTQDLRYQGYRPMLVTAHASGGRTHFGLLWQNLNFSHAALKYIDDTVEQVRRQENLNGLSLAVTRNGRLVFAKGYGAADSGIPVHTSHRFRIASISKTLTAIGIMRLVQSGRLGLDWLVFGPNGVLGETYGAASSYADFRVLHITVRHLLAHQAGGWDNQPGGRSADPMFIEPWLGLTHAGLITRVLDDVELDAAPGTQVGRYSNFGYSVLGRIIEKVSGKPYETFMRDEVLSPSGATSFAIGRTAAADCLPNEVAYYQPSMDPAVAMLPYDSTRTNVPRMDSHGGWVATPVDLTRILLRADGYSTVPDLLDSSSIYTMTQAHTYFDGEAYGFGWSLNGGKWSHTGLIWGAQGAVARVAEPPSNPGKGAFTWAVLTNTTSRNSLGALDAMMENIVSNVGTWPAQDLY